jgi:adenylate cyclase
VADRDADADADTDAGVRGGKARQAGAATMAALRRATARKAAALIRSDPDNAATALEIGLVDQEWLDAPAEHPISSSTPGSILRRFLERTVETRPSLLSSLGLTAVQLLSSGSEEVDGKGAGAGRPMTIVFTDLEGFTAYTDAQGDAAALAMIDAHHRLARPVVRRWNGRIVKHLGDGLLCTFPDPAAGVHAAIHLLGTAPDPLRLRAGVHAGDAVSTRDDVVGHVVNVAARVCEAAKGGQVLVSEEVRTASGALDDVRFGRIRARRMKGVKERVGVCEATLLPVSPVATTS